LVSNDAAIHFLFGEQNQRSFVLVLFQVAIHAVIAGVQLAATNQLPERRITVSRVVCQYWSSGAIRLFAETFREVFFAESLHGSWIVQVGCPMNLAEVGNILPLPVNGDLASVSFARCGGHHRNAAPFFFVFLVSGVIFLELWPRYLLP